MSEKQAKLTKAQVNTYKTYQKNVKLENTAISETTTTLDKIFKLGVNPSEYYKRLFAAGFTISGWPTSKKGVLLSAQSNSGDNTPVKMFKEVERLVGAYARRNATRKVAEKAAAAAVEYDENATTEKPETVDVQVIPPTEAPEAPEAPEKSKVDHGDSAPRVETSDKDMVFDAVTLIESLQGFMVALSSESLQLSAKDSKRAHKLAKELVELAQNA